MITLLSFARKGSSSERKFYLHNPSGQYMSICNGVVGELNVMPKIQSNVDYLDLQLGDLKKVQIVESQDKGKKEY